MNNIGSESIKAISSNLGSDLYSLMKNSFKKMRYSSEAEFIIKLEKYIEFSIDKIGNVKTLFYDNKAQNLLDFYEPLNVKSESHPMNDYFFDETVGDKSKVTIETESISNFMKDKQNILFTGNGGCGKTMLMKYLFLNCLDEEYKIPIYIELRHFNNFNGSLFDFIYKTISEMHFDIDKEHFKYTLKSDRYLFLFDAFDEVYPEKSEMLSQEIKSFSTMYSDNKFIITSRFSLGFVDWSSFSKYNVCGLTKQQSISLIDKIKVYEEIKKDFINELESNLYIKYQSFASSPLLLNIMLITYESTSTLPDRLNGFYEKAFEALFYSHDLSKNRYKRKMKSELGYDDFKKIFNRVCFKSYIKSDYTFNFDKITALIEEAKKAEDITSFKSEDYLEDLQINLCMLIKDGFDFYFTHRSFQEYFAASFIMLKTDEQQKNIFNIMIKNKHVTAGVENFWQIMYEMQKERFIENVIFYHLNPLLKYDDILKEYVCDMYSGMSVMIDEEDGELLVSYSHYTRSNYAFPMRVFKKIIRADYSSVFKKVIHDSEKVVGVSEDINKKLIETLGLKLNQFHSSSCESLFEDRDLRKSWEKVGFGRIKKAEIERYIIWHDYYEKSDNNIEDDLFIDSL